MEDLSSQATYKSDSGTVEIGLRVFQFVEDGLNFYFSPDLDLSGYGNSVEEARKSFKESLGEFITYTIHKKTLEKELIKHGWKIIRARKKRPKSYNSPDLSVLLRENEYLVDIVNNKDFSKTNQIFNVPAYA